MTSLILSAGLVTLPVLAVLVFFLFRSRPLVSDNRRSLNVAVYRDQLTELEREHQEGSLGDEDFAQAQEEVKRRLLEDTAVTPEVTDYTHGRKVALAVLLAIPVAAAALYMWRGHPEALNPQEVPQVSEKQIQTMVSTLQAKLDKNPDNPQGWAMLARSYMTLDRPKEAVKAFAHLVPQMDRGDTSLMVDYAEALAASGEDPGMVQAQGWVNKALALEPGNAKGLFMAGGFAFASKDFRKADTYWEKLMPLLEPGSQDASFVLENLNAARAQIKLPPLSADKFQMATGPSTPASANASSTVTGHVSVDPALKDKMAASDTVFIFARSVGGPPMPLAVLRATGAQLPMDFQLTDAMAMSPQFNLSSAGLVTVEVRVSKSGTANPTSGDLLGSSLPIRPGAHGVQLVINRVQP